MSAESEAPLDGFGNWLAKAEQLPISSLGTVEISDKPTWASIEPIGVHLDISSWHYPISHLRSLCTLDLDTESRHGLTWLRTHLALLMGRRKDA